MANGMNEPAAEGVLWCLCDYWWLLLVVVAVGLALFFGRSYFL